MRSVFQILNEHGINPKKSFGQHFLIAGPTAEKIVAALKCDKDDIVLEIGPGPAVLTRLLAPRVKKVIAVDADARMIEIARDELSEFENVEFVKSDILKFDPPLNKKQKIKVIGNLPYNISSQIFFWLIDNREKFSKAIVMVQKEVATRVIAKAGKEFGILSVIMQAFADCKKLFDVSAKSFFPPPKVVSSVIEIDLSKPFSDDCDLDSLKKIVKASFAKRRKTVKNSLTMSLKELSSTQIDEMLSVCEIVPTVRPEQIPLKKYLEMAKYYKSLILK